MNEWYVLTGGPCAGKTTLIEALEAKGYKVMPEAARVHIEAGFAQGKTIEEIRADEVEFQREILRLKVAQEKKLSAEDKIFFDRGMHDSAAYLELHGVKDDPELMAAVAGTGYKKVFLLDIISYEADGVRTETPEQAQEIHKRLGKAYSDAGQLVERVPVLPVEERLEYILQRL